MACALCIALGTARGQPAEISLEDPRQDFAFLEFEPYSHFKSQSDSNNSQSQYWRIADQASFPMGHVDGHFLFGSFKNTVIDRDIVYDGRTLNGGLLQRYWLSGGVTLMDSPTQTSYVMAAVGMNGDFDGPAARDLNTEWIYVHGFPIHPGFKWGMGVDVQQYLDRIVPYPLIFLEWRLSRNTKLNWDADLMELRRFFGPKLSFALGARFNLEFFALKQDASYEYRSLGAEAGTQYSLGGNFYLRFKYKELIAGREVLETPDGVFHPEWIRSGRSLRLNLAYGI